MTKAGKQFYRLLHDANEPYPQPPDIDAAIAAIEAEAVAARNAEIAAAVRGLEVLHHNTSPQFWYPGPPPEPDEWLHRAAVLAIVEKGLDTRA